MEKSRDTLQRELAQADQRIEELGRERDILKKENAILTLALKWYANPDHWFEVRERDPDLGLGPAQNAIDNPDASNPGGKARRALERAAKKL